MRGSNAWIVMILIPTRPFCRVNALCMRCHSGGYSGSSVIQPDQHMFHPNETPGGRCVDCHMPQTTYMQRHPRRDHGFTIPDPLLTQELGVPNACNRCHETTDWAIEATERCARSHGSPDPTESTLRLSLHLQRGFAPTHAGHAER